MYSTFSLGNKKIQQIRRFLAPWINPWALFQNTIPASAIEAMVWANIWRIKMLWVPLSNKEKEAVNLVISQVNGCVYCQIIHTVQGKRNAFSNEQILNLRKGQGENAKLNALVQLNSDITQKGCQLNAGSKAALYQQGYNDENLVDSFVQISDKFKMNYLLIWQKSLSIFRWHLWGILRGATRAINFRGSLLTKLSWQPISKKIL